MLKVLSAVTAAAAFAVPVALGAPQPELPTPAAPPAIAIQPGVAVVSGIAHHITGSAALAAASIPGAMTEVAPGLTLRQAVGLDTTATRRLARAMASTQCWSQSSGLSWDVFPYDRHLTDTTSWCGAGGTLTYRSSHTSQGQNFCSPKGTYGYILAGGAGQSYVAWREGGNWACPSPLPYITFYPNDWMSIYANGSGGYWIYESGGN